MTREEMMMGVYTLGSHEIYEPVEGLLLEPDTSPYTSVCMNYPYDAMFDGDYEAVVSGWWTSIHAYGLDLGAAEQVRKLTVYLVESHGTAGGWWPGYEGNQMDIYKSPDRCNWTLVQVNDAPTLSGVVGAFCKAELTLPAPTIARYWKVLNSDPNELTSIEGWSYGITEIEAI